MHGFSEEEDKKLLSFILPHDCAEDEAEKACAFIIAFSEEFIIFLIVDILLFLWKDPKGHGGMAASKIVAHPPPAAPGAAAPAATAAPIHHAPPPSLGMGR